MTLSTIQKLQIFIIKGLMLPLWISDVAAEYTSKRFYARALSYSLLFLLLIGIIYIPLNKASLSQNYRDRVSRIRNSLAGQNTNLEVPKELDDGQILGAGEEAVKKPVLVKKSAFPFITARAHLIVDNNTQTILSEHNINTTFAPASTTKLMTALISSEIYNENEIIEIKPECLEIESTKLWLPVGYKFTVRNLLYSLLVSSAGDAGCLLASSKLDMNNFIDLMNEKASELGMTNSRFTNPVGLDGVDGSHYSSAWDLYILSKEVMEDPLLKDIVKTKTYTFNDVTGNLEINIINTNKLLWEIPETKGVKTGTTSGAGEVLVYNYGDEDKDFTIIVMLSEDRFEDTKNLVEWTLSSYEWR